VTAAVIPIAGLSSRFREFTDIPKWALRIQGKSILELAARSILEPELNVSRIILVHNELHSELLTQILSKLDLAVPINTLPLNLTPNGQALSVMNALPSIGDDEPFIVWNGDTVLRDGWAKNLSFDGNWLLLANLEGDHWSFAQIENGFVQQTSEKVRISNHASVGLYAFDSKRQFAFAVENDMSPGEIFVAPLYNKLLSSGDRVRGILMSSEDFFPLGTPAEVISTCKKWGVPPPIELINTSTPL